METGVARTRFIACKGGGRPHRCRTKSLPSDPSKPDRPRPGKGVQWLRRMLTFLAKQSGGRCPWAEVDLNKLFNFCLPRRFY